MIAQPRIALIHALSHSVTPINSALNVAWQTATRMNLVDDSLSQDLAVKESKAQGSGLDEQMHARFLNLGRYAKSTGADAILFTCSAFGSCIEAVKEDLDIPVLKPNEAMIEALVAHVGDTDAKVGLLSSFAPTLTSMPPEFPAHIDLACYLADGAMAALNAGDVVRHDELMMRSARQAVSEGAKVLALAQYSNAHMKAPIEAALGVPVFTTPDSAIAKLKHLLCA